MESKPLRVFSYGGGVQSNAVLVLASQDKVQYDAFVFANVGNDSENPDTIDYIRDYAIPFAEKHGIKYIEVQKRNRAGELVTLLDMINQRQKSVVIPAHMGAKGGRAARNCTTETKIDQIDKYIRRELKERGLRQADDRRAVIGLGISVDEFQRVRSTEWHNMVGKKKLGFWKQREYPLINLRLTRAKCHELIINAGLPQPPKSSCFFCPFKKPSEWVELRDKRPDLFEVAVGIEKTLNDKPLSRKGGIFLHAKSIPLSEIDTYDTRQLPLWSVDDEQCDDGVCMV